MVKIGETSELTSELTPNGEARGGPRRTVAFGSMKGGVGKSSATTNVAVALWGADRSVCIIDADLPQATSAAWYDRRVERRGEQEGFSCRRVAARYLARTLREVQADVVLVDLPGRDDPGLPNILKLVDLLQRVAEARRHQNQILHVGALLSRLHTSSHDRGRGVSTWLRGSRRKEP